MANTDGGATDTGGGLASSVVMVGVVSTVMPRAAVAASAESSVVLSELETSALVVEAGTAITAVMMTDPSEVTVMLMLTSDAFTPAVLAMDAWRVEVSS